MNPLSIAPHSLRENSLIIFRYFLGLLDFAHPATQELGEISSLRNGEKNGEKWKMENENEKMDRPNYWGNNP